MYKIVISNYFNFKQETPRSAFSKSKVENLQLNPFALSKCVHVFVCVSLFTTNSFNQAKIWNYPITCNLFKSKSDAFVI